MTHQTLCITSSASMQPRFTKGQEFNIVQTKDRGVRPMYTVKLLVNSLANGRITAFHGYVLTCVCGKT